MAMCCAPRSPNDHALSYSKSSASVELTYLRQPLYTHRGPFSIPASTYGPSTAHHPKHTRSGPKFCLKLISSSHMHMVLPLPTLTRTDMDAMRCSLHYSMSVHGCMCSGTFTLAGAMSTSDGTWCNGV